MVSEERLKQIREANAAGHRNKIQEVEILEQVLKNQLAIMERFNMTDVNTQVLLKRIEDVRANG